MSVTRMVPVLQVADVPATSRQLCQALSLVALVEGDMLAVLADDEGNDALVLQSTATASRFTPAFFVDVDNVEAARRSALLAGSEILIEPFETDHDRRLYARTPDGTVMVVRQQYVRAHAAWARQVAAEAARAAS